MSRVVALLASVFMMGGMIFGESPIVTAIGNFYPSTVCKLGSQVSGRVEEVMVDVGDSIKKGQPLIQLDKKAYEIAVAEKVAMLQSTKVELEDAELNFKRMKNLWHKPQGQTPAISRKRYEEAKMRYEQAQAQVIKDQQALNHAKLNLEETTIRASCDGIVANRFVDPGEAITTTPITQLIEIQGINPLYLEFSVPQTYAHAIKVGSPITFEVEGTDNKKYHAKIDVIYPGIDESTRSITYRAVIDNSAQEFQPGALVKVKINKYDSP